MTIGPTPLPPPFRIVDAVFARDDRPFRKRRVVLALGAAVGLHLFALGWGAASAPSLETWSAELATRVHAELTREEVVELPPEKAPEKPPEVPSPPPSTTRPVPSANRSPRAARPIPSRAPAQAGRILAAAPSAANLGGTTFVTGNAARYAGGTTASSGTSSSAVSGPVGGGAPTAAPLPSVVRPARKGPDKSAPVRLPDTDWTCAWPTEAEDEDIDEQSVVLEVTVKSDGTAESVRVLRDPGHGFGAAARACALATRFSPAADAEGHAVRAPSPPIRVHFTR